MHVMGQEDYSNPGDCLGDPLSHQFFNRDPVVVARDLIGRVLLSSAEGVETGGRIVEAEAYCGSSDPGSHAATKGMTSRNAVMYGPPGTVYVYFTYGNHHMINLVCESEGHAGAVLIRALEPLWGLDAMRRRRGRTLPQELCNGPGKCAQALGVDLSDNGTALGQGRLQVYSGSRSENVEFSGRIGLSSGHDLPYRFFESGSPFVSRGRVGPRPPRLRGEEGTS